VPPSNNLEDIDTNSCVSPTKILVENEAVFWVTTSTILEDWQAVP
jgi:hypothetical protein